jgi:hypothetical protein
MGKKKNPEIRIATVEMERGQSEMATLPAGGHRGVGTSDEAPEKHNDDNREMEERLESPPRRFAINSSSSFQILQSRFGLICIFRPNFNS